MRVNLKDKPTKSIFKTCLCEIENLLESKRGRKANFTQSSECVFVDQIAHVHIVFLITFRPLEKQAR